MLKQISKILGSEFSEVVRSPELSLSLLSCYSFLYLGGAAPRVCEKSQKQYYEQLKINGMEKAMKISENRTAVPAWSGRKYVGGMCTHLSSATVSDEVCTQSLMKGFLKESDFETLPEGLAEARANASEADKAKAEADKAKAEADEAARVERLKNEAAANAEANSFLKKSYAVEVLATLESLNKVNVDLLRKLVIDLELDEGEGVKADYIKSLDAFRENEESIL